MKWVDAVIFGHPVKIAFDEQSVHVYNAFPVKEDLKRRGYRWNPKDKAWFVRPPDPGAEIRELKGESPAETEEPKAGETPPVSGDGYPDSYSVAALQNHLDDAIRRSIPGRIWIRGVVASQVKNYRWASYFDLRDEDEKLQMFFRCEVRTEEQERIEKQLQKLNVAEKLGPDLPVFLQVEISLSRRYAVDVRLTVVDILPEYTRAKLKSQLDLTVEKLKSEGILENQKRLRLPRLLSIVGLITSEKGTSVRDIMAGLHPYERKYAFFFLDSRMEGRNAVDNITRALDLLVKEQKGLGIEAIIIARGGGSEQSLAVFNDLSLCRKVCRLQIPVISAIGHEKDLSAIELCSHLTPTPSTPSGIGKYLQNRYVELQNDLAERIRTLLTQMAEFNNREYQRMVSLNRRLQDRVDDRYRQEKRGLRHQVRRFSESAGIRLRMAAREMRIRVRQVRGAAGLLAQKQWPRLYRLFRRFDVTRLLRIREGQRERVGDTAGRYLAGARRTLDFGERGLSALRELAESHHPDRILKKGFALILDREGRVVPSRKTFDRLSEARVRFRDGLRGILRKEEKDDEENGNL